jgi:phosphopantetheinyl transferase
MPLYKIINCKKSSIYVWKIEENLEQLLAEVKLKETSNLRLKTMTSISHQKGFLAVRMLLQYLNLSDYDLFYSETGKPFLTTGKIISITHAHDFSVIMLSDGSCGIDIEKKKEKIIKIGPRFCDEAHLNENHESKALAISKYTIAWGVKEAIFKIKNEAGISFPKHITIEPFTKAEGYLNAKLFFNHKEEHFIASFQEFEYYVLVWIET